MAKNGDQDNPQPQQPKPQEGDNGTVQPEN